MKCLVGLLFPVLFGVVLSAPLNSNVQGKKPPVVDGVGDENLDPKADQMTRKLINGVGEEEGPYLRAKRTLKADGYVEDKKPPVVDGVGDENLDPIADQMARKLINGVGEEEGQHRKVKRTLMSDATVWHQYRPEIGTQWCTSKGRDLIEKHLSLLECQVRCEEMGPNCTAVEYWEGSGSCYECTNGNMVTQYTATHDIGYPVYVWVIVISDWQKYQPDLGTQWCTFNGRDVIDKNLSLLECQVRCEERGPDCTAVEYWEGSGSCYECTDPSIITKYTNANDLGYPVYVWVRELKNPF